MLNKLKKSFSYKAIQVLVLFLYSLFLIPILLKNWDLEIYGSWIAIYAFFNIIRVIEQGHGKFIGNLFNHEVHNNEMYARIAIGSALRINLLVGVLQLSIIYIFYYFHVFELFFTTGIDAEQVAIVLTILFIYRMFFGSFRGILVKMLNPFGLIYISFQFAIMEKILEFSILVIAAVTGISLVELSIFWALVMSVYSIFIIVRLKMLLPNYYPFWKYGTLQIGFENFKKSLLFASSNFLNKLWNEGLVLVIAAVVGTSFLPLFTATKTIVNYGHKVSDLFLAPVVPEMINQYSKHQKKNILDIFRSYWFITSVILISTYSLSLLFIDKFFIIWTKGMLSFNFVLFAVLVVVVLFQNYGKVLFLFFTGINKTKTVFITSVLQVIIFFSVLFIFKDKGLLAVLLALLCSSFIVMALWLPYNIFKIFSLSLKQQIVFYTNLITTGCLILLFYCFYNEYPVWVQFILILPILYLFYYQYLLISKKTRNIIRDSFLRKALFITKKE